MDIMDCQSFLLLKKKITETELVLNKYLYKIINLLWPHVICSELITKCQFLQNQLELVQRDQAKQQMELKSMENVSTCTTHVVHAHALSCPRHASFVNKKVVHCSTQKACILPLQPNGKNI